MAEQLLVMEEVEGQRRDCLGLGEWKTVSIDLSVDDAGNEYGGHDHLCLKDAWVGKESA